MSDWAMVRERMVAEQLQGRGIRDPRVLDAMRRVLRHLFVPPDEQANAYEDRALRIGQGQTISQPYMVGAMTEGLGLDSASRVLEIGTGSGYQAAILAEVAREVITIERKGELAEEARRRLAALSYANVSVVEGDGTLGYPSGAPFDGIIVTAAAPRVPASLQSQLADRARLVVPVGSELHQDMVIIQRLGDRFTETRGDPCVFVPLMGQEGWPET